MATSATRVGLPRPHSNDGTRERLLATALRLFAEEGLNGASLRRIVMEAGAANPSALHYHFGDRQALLEALADRIFGGLRELALPRLAELKTRRHTVREVLEAMYRPVIEIRETGEAGRHAVQFLARLSWEFGPEGQALSSGGLAPIAEPALGLLEALLPGRDRDHLRFRLLMTMANVFHGLADYHYLALAPFGPRKALLGPRGQPIRDRIFFDYLEAGIRSGAD